MKNAEIAELASHLLKTNPGCSVCLRAMDVLRHTQTLQTFVGDLVKHHTSPGSPEKTAEHYQIVHRAKALTALT